MGAMQLELGSVAGNELLGKALGLSERCEVLGYDQETGLAYLDISRAPKLVREGLAVYCTVTSGVPVVYFCARCTRVSRSWLPTELVLVITNSAVYHCELSGKVKRSIGLEEITELLHTEDNWVGMRVPSAYDFIVKPRSPKDSRTLTDVLLRLHAQVMERLQKDTPLRLRRVRAGDKPIKQMLKIDKPKGYNRVTVRMIDTRPESELRRHKEPPRPVRVHYSSTSPQTGSPARRGSEARPGSPRRGRGISLQSQGLGSGLTGREPSGFVEYEHKT
eukprot:Hpha_TRINITY_DN27527_c0_g1::TRINITY_DN27527_c0_g1_i1::g.86215::m.86215